MSTYFLDHRPLEIDKLALSGSLIISRDAPSVPGRYSSLGQLALPEFIDNSYIERDFHFSNRPLFQKVKSRYYGYFQSPKYFVGLETELRQIFSLRTTSTTLAGLIEEIQSVSVVGIHLRRGDYIGKEHYHGLTGSEYFHSALKIFKKEDPLIKVVVFTEDIKLAKEIFPDAWKIVTPSELDSSSETLTLMSHFSKFIGSNSSFSWWAAFLHGASAQEVIFPRPWFATTKNNDRDLLMPQWLTLGNETSN